MPRFLLSWILGLAGAAIGLVLSNVIFGDNFKFSGIGGFLLALLVFAILSAIIPGIIMKLLQKHADTMTALTGLISAFLALFLTAITPWLNVSGVSTWIWATLLLWVLGMIIWVIPGPWRNYRKERIAR